VHVRTWNLLSVFSALEIRTRGLQHVHLCMAVCPGRSTYLAATQNEVDVSPVATMLAARRWNCAREEEVGDAMVSISTSRQNRQSYHVALIIMQQCETFPRSKPDAHVTHRNKQTSRQ
jgi:hypothetical protein